MVKRSISSDPAAVLTAQFLSDRNLILIRRLYLRSVDSGHCKVHVENQACALKFLSGEKGTLYAYCLVTEGPFGRKLLELKSDLL